MFDPSTFAAVTLKTSLLIAAIGLIALLTTKKSAACRHFLWAAALALSLLMPFGVAYMPSYPLISLPWRTSEHVVQLARESALPAGRPQSARDAGRFGARDNARTSDVNGAVSRSFELRSYPLLRASIAIWLAGMLGLMIRHALAQIGLMWWVRRARPLHSEAWVATLNRVSEELPIRRRVRVLQSDDLTGPCTWGFMRHVLVLPTAGARWSEPQRRYALMHEFAHIRRLDYVTTVIANYACAVHWYNPLVWFAAARMRKLQEEACDDTVLRAGGKPSDYAELLLQLAEFPQPVSRLFPIAVNMAQRSELHDRVVAILDPSRARLPLTRLGLLTALVSLSFLTLVLAGASAGAAPGEQMTLPLAGTFNSIELRNGGTVRLRYGSAQRVMLIKGDPQSIELAISGKGRLEIDHRSHGRGLEIEVTTPHVGELSVSNGGAIESAGPFPRQQELVAAVEQGGTIDIRSMAVDSVTASVNSGGRIFTRPRDNLSASVARGGAITYWGDARVTSSAPGRGVVTKGTAADADRPLSDWSPQLAELHALSPIPPVPPIRPVPPIPPR